MTEKTATTQRPPETELVYEPISPPASELVAIQRILGEMTKTFLSRRNDAEMPVII